MPDGRITTRLKKPHYILQPESYPVVTGKIKKILKFLQKRPKTVFLFLIYKKAGLKMTARAYIFLKPKLQKRLLGVKDTKKTRKDGAGPAQNLCSACEGFTHGLFYGI